MSEDLAERPRYAVPALEKGLDLLEHLSAQATPLTQAQLARALNRQPGEIFRMLTCLEARGYLSREPASGAYALTLKLFELSRTHSPHEALLRAARPLMRALSDQLGESCHLSVLHHGQVLVLAQEESPRPFRLSVEAGSLHDPAQTTSGRVLLAFAREPERDEALAGLTAEYRDALPARLEEIRARGFEQSEGERFTGGLDLGVLVGAPGAAVQAALTIATLKTHDGPDLTAMLPSLRACAAAIAARAGLESAA